MTATCDDPDAFETPVFHANTGTQSMDWIHPSRQHGEGLFGTEELACRLGIACWEAFDELLASATLRRTTSAASALGWSEEWRVALSSTSSVKVVTNLGTYASALTGSVGYSFCESGNDTAPCPFFLGSLNAEATSNIFVPMICDDQTTSVQTISSLTIALGQPAFGMAQEDTDAIAFPPGALVVDVSSQQFTHRAPNGLLVQLEAAGPTFSADPFEVGLTVPCNSSRADITVEISLVDSSGTATKVISCL